MGKQLLLALPNAKPATTSTSSFFSATLDAL
jgi:hypothetical protein